MTAQECTEFYKLLRKDEVHRGYQFNTGLHIDPNPWDISKECCSGGFYFCKKENIPDWIQLYDDLSWIRPVRIPADAKIHHEPMKSKADTINLGERISISEFLHVHMLEMAVIVSNPHNLSCIEYQTPELCLAAVKRNGLTLRHVKQQTPTICLAAVETDGRAIKFVKEQTPELCLVAIKQNPFALDGVKEQTHELCLAAVQRNGYTIHCVREQTPELCMAAVQNTRFALHHVREKTPEILKAAGWDPKLGMIAIRCDSYCSL